MSQQPQDFHGQCQCGALQYRVSGTPLTLFACHCTECQRQTASAFGMALWVREPQVHVEGGELAVWTRSMPSGKTMACSSCPSCGTRLFHQVQGQAQILSIKPGTLNNTRWLEPVGHIWTDSKQPWVQLAQGALQYPQNPPDFAGLMAAWSAQHG
ncbi:MAG: GFA family protein [Pseudomonadota bacterium]